MPLWLNGRIQGPANIERELFVTEDRAHEALINARRKHEERGDRTTDVLRGPHQVCEVFDRNGEQVAVYWLSDTSDAPEP